MCLRSRKGEGDDVALRCGNVRRVEGEDIRPGTANSNLLHFTVNKGTMRLMKKHRAYVNSLCGSDTSDGENGDGRREFHGEGSWVKLKGEGGSKVGGVKR